TAGRFVLVLPMAAAMAEGDAYEAFAGCDKSFGTCRTRFSNAVNFRGEPHVPGLDRMLETSSTRSTW
ncbi:MAG: beta tubulin, partial [Alphaproteobacteria bacterium]|nr:beta tubulin [Alphaproteobacteria bacterium]